MYGHVDHQVKCPVGKWKLVVRMEKRSTNCESSMRAVRVGEISDGDNRRL